MIDFLSINVTNTILIILLIAVLVLFCLYLYTDNRRLKAQLEEIRKENKTLLEKKIKNQVDVDAVSIQKISTENEKNITDNLEKIDIKKNEEPIEKTINVSKEVNHDKEKEIQDNDKKNYNEVLDRVYNVTSNQIYNEEAYYNLEDNTISNNFDLNDLINKNNFASTKEERKYPTYDYLEEIQAKMNAELKPQTIELTDYEKKQEEQAVISYKELLKVKETNQYSEEKQDTMKFIEELKMLRNSLK